MRMAFKVSSIFIALIIIITIIPAIIPDEEYTPDVEQWLKDANNPEKIPAADNRFNALVGLYVDADKDMITEGAKLVAEINQQLGDPANKNSATLKLNTYWKNQPLKTSKDLSGMTSTAFDENPAQWLASNQDKYKSLVKNNLVLLDRFRELMTMKKYSHTMKPDIRAPFVLYNNFLAIKRLHNLSIISEFTAARNKQNAITKLKQSITFSRLMMKQSAILLDKMVATNLLKTDLLTYSSLLDQAPTEKISDFVINNLQDDERSMLNAYKGEFAMLSASLDIESAFALGGSSSKSGFFENFAIKYYLKPKTLENNSQNKIWAPLLELKNFSLATRKTMAADIGEIKLSWWQIYKDPIGYILINIAAPSYSVYADRIDHTDARISLLNLKAAITSNNIPANRVENYIANSSSEMNKGYKGAKFSWNKDKQELSYDIPDYKDERIPRIKINIL